MNRKNDNRLKEKGVTLLESIVATAVIAIGFIAIFQERDMSDSIMNSIQDSKTSI